MANIRVSRAISIVLLLIMIFVIFFSVNFISKNMNHDCCEDQCPVCAIIVQCSNNLKTIGAALIVSVVCLFSYDAFYNKDNLVILVEECDSLISKKIRMNN